MTKAKTLGCVVILALLAAPFSWGDVVLLAPGGTSFDNYTNFAVRGEHFRKLVEGIAEMHA